MLIILLIIAVLLGVVFLKLILDGIAINCIYCDIRTNRLSRWFLIWYHRTYALFTGGHVVVLKDYKDTVRITIAYETDHIRGTVDGEVVYFAYIYYMSQIGNIMLLDNGIVLNANQGESYITHWLPLNLEKRTWMVLQGAKNFDY